MEPDTHLWLELETSDRGPSGIVRDDSGRTRRFSGWLELIAAIDAPGAWGHTDVPSGDRDPMREAVDERVPAGPGTAGTDHRGAASESQSPHAGTQSTQMEPQ